LKVCHGRRGRSGDELGRQAEGEKSPLEIELINMKKRIII
jgi:hypothetical protein